MNILILHEKYGNRYIAAGETDAEIETALIAVIKERINSDIWYTDKEKADATLAIEQNKVRRWIISRTGEYEHISVAILETLT